MIIPSVDFWEREEFLAARKEQLAFAKKNSSKAVIFIDTGDDVICDTCNAEILDQMINLVEFGRRVNCDACYQKYYAKEPVKYRTLRADGGLGQYVTVEEK